MQPTLCVVFPFESLPRHFFPFCHTTGRRHANSFKRIWKISGKKYFIGREMNKSVIKQNMCTREDNVLHRKREREIAVMPVRWRHFLLLGLSSYCVLVLLHAKTLYGHRPWWLPESVKAEDEDEAKNGGKRRRKRRERIDDEGTTQSRGQNVTEPRLPRVLSIFLLPTRLLMCVLSTWTIKAINQSNSWE